MTAIGRIRYPTTFRDKSSSHNENDRTNIGSKAMAISKGILYSTEPPQQMKSQATRTKVIDMTTRVARILELNAVLLLTFLTMTYDTTEPVIIIVIIARKSPIIRNCVFGKSIEKAPLSSI